MRRIPALLTLSFGLLSASYAQAPDAWSPVQRVAPGTLIKVSAAKGGGACILQMVSAESLVCARGKSTRSIARSDIKSIKFARRGRSAGLGLASGAGIGAVAGVGIGTAVNSSNTGSFVHTSTPKSAGLGAAVGVLVGGVTGGLVGYSTDLFASPTIYKR